MKIGFLVDSISRNAGGLFQSVRRLAQSVSSPANSVEVFGLEDSHAAEDLAQWRPIPVSLSRRRLGGIGFSEDLAGNLVKAQLDVLQTHGIWKYSSYGSSMWHRKTRRPYVVHPHGMLDPWAVRNSGWKKRIAGFLFEHDHLRQAGCLRALGESEASSIRAYGLSNPICVIPNGIDIPVGLAECQPPWAAKREKVLLYLGRLHPKKNLGALLSAWALVQRDGGSAKDWQLVIAGWDQAGYEQRLREQAEQLDLNDSVIFPGPYFDDLKAAAYQSCAAFVLPSLSEGLPMVVLEAWAFQKPVLMTEQCNLPEGFQDGAAVRIGGSPEEIAGGLRQLFSMNDSEREAMGHRGVLLAARRFSWSAIGDEMRRVCEWLVEGAPPPESVRFN